MGNGTGKSLLVEDLNDARDNLIPLSLGDEGTYLPFNFCGERRVYRPRRGL